jgi:cullin 1
VDSAIGPQDSNEECLDVYKEHIEAPFVEATELYYQRESENFLAQNNAPDRPKKAEERLDLEVSRFERYLCKTDAETRKDIINQCRLILMGERAQLV